MKPEIYLEKKKILKKIIIFDLIIKNIKEKLNIIVIRVTMMIKL